MSVSITRGLLVIDLQVLVSLVLVNREIEVGLGLHLLVDITGNGFTFLFV